MVAIVMPMLAAMKKAMLRMMKAMLRSNTTRGIKSTATRGRCGTPGP